MKINNETFNKLIKGLPSNIPVKLEWKHETGYSEVEDYKLDTGNYIVFASFFVYENGIIEESDGTTPHPSSKNINALDFSFEVYHEPTDEQIYLTDEHTSQLIEKVRTLIKTN